MVVVPCRAALKAARWKGHAAQKTTGVASTASNHITAMDSGIAMDTATTGMAITTATMSRRNSVGSPWMVCSASG